MTQSLLLWMILHRHVKNKYALPKKTVYVRNSLLLQLIIKVDIEDLYIIIHAGLSSAYYRVLIHWFILSTHLVMFFFTTCLL